MTIRISRFCRIPWTNVQTRIVAGNAKLKHRHLRHTISKLPGLLSLVRVWTVVESSLPLLRSSSNSCRVWTHGMASLGELLATEGFERGDSSSDEIETVLDNKDGTAYKLRFVNELYEDEDAPDVNPQGTKLADLDQAPIKAVVLILTGFIACFFQDERLRASIKRRCASCLGTRNDTGPVGILKQAIVTVERAIEGGTSPQDVKKASMQLSIIAGLDSSQLKGGYTFGVPNLHLAACAHLYLSVVYKLENKDDISAKHLLHVFSDCPNQARTVLLPKLWGLLFLPHLSHLREWYLYEAESIRRAGDRAKKLALLEEVYKRNLDTGTNMLAVYYKKWLLDRGEAPEAPSIPIPNTSFLENSGEVLHASDESRRPSTSSSYQVTVSKEL